MIKLNVVGIEIDGKVYKVRKLPFGTRRKIVDLQSAILNEQKKISKKYNVKISEIASSKAVSQEDQLNLAKINMEIMDILAELFVVHEESSILDLFDDSNITEFINAIQ